MFKGVPELFIIRKKKNIFASPKTGAGGSCRIFKKI